MSYEKLLEEIHYEVNQIKTARDLGHINAKEAIKKVSELVDGTEVMDSICNDCEEKCDPDERGEPMHNEGYD